MKTTSMIGMVVAMMMFATIQLNAQAIESSVKILKTPNPKVVKVLYAQASQEPISIRFISATGQTFTDKVAANPEKGFMKKYDIRKIDGSNYWVEVSSASSTVTYRVVRAKDGSFIPYLERSTNNYEVAASLK